MLKRAMKSSKSALTRTNGLVGGVPEDFLEEASYTLQAISKGMAQMKAYLVDQDLETASPKIYALGQKITIQETVPETMENFAEALDQLSKFNILKQVEKVFNQDSAEELLKTDYKWANDYRDQFTPEIASIPEVALEFQQYILEMKNLEKLMDQKAAQPATTPVQTELF